MKGNLSKVVIFYWKETKTRHVSGILISFIFEIKTTDGKDLTHRIDANREDTIIETKHKVLFFINLLNTTLNWV